MDEKVIILGHGSNSSKAQEVFNDIVDKVSSESGIDEVYGASMSFSEPKFNELAKRLISEGADKLVIVPLFMYPGVHVREDVPEMIDNLREDHPEIVFELRDCIGADERLVNIISDKI